MGTTKQLTEKEIISVLETLVMGHIGLSKEKEDYETLNGLLDCLNYIHNINRKKT